MSHSSIVRFPSHGSRIPDNDPHGADQARQRIASLPDPYNQHAVPTKENLVGAIAPVSPAATPNAVAQAQPAVIAAAPATHAAPAVEYPKQSKEAAAKTKSSEKSGGRFKLPPKVARFKPLIAAVITFALLYVVFKAPIFLNQIHYLTSSKPASTQSAPAAGATVPAANTLSIPKINVNAPVIYATNNSEAAIQKDLESGVVHYAGTANPGENGNGVIFGHSSNDWWEPGNYKFAFVLLDKLQPGDTFTINYQSKQYLYQVYAKKVVEPTDLSVLKQTSTPEATLITCTPPGTSWKRLVVQAKQISPAPSEAKANSVSGNSGVNGEIPGSTHGITESISNAWNSVLKAIGLSHDKQSTQPDTNSGTTLPAAQ